MGTGLLEIAFSKERGSKKMVNAIARYLSDYRSGPPMSLYAARALFLGVLGEAQTRVLIESVYGTGTPDTALLIGFDAIPDDEPEPELRTPPPAVTHAVAVSQPPSEPVLAAVDPFDGPFGDWSDREDPAPIPGFGDFVAEEATGGFIYFDDVVRPYRFRSQDFLKCEAIIAAHRAGVVDDSYAKVQMALVLMEYPLQPDERVVWAGSMFKHLRARPHWTD